MEFGAGVCEDKELDVVSVESRQCPPGSGLCERTGAISAPRKLSLSLTQFQARVLRHPGNTRACGTPGWEHQTPQDSGACAFLHHPPDPHLALQQHRGKEAFQTPKRTNSPRNVPKRKEFPTLDFQQGGRALPGARGMMPSWISLDSCGAKGPI